MTIHLLDTRTHTNLLTGSYLYFLNLQVSHLLRDILLRLPEIEDGKISVMSPW